MEMKISLLVLPAEKFLKLITEYSEWIDDVDTAAFLYIELNRCDIRLAEDIVRILQKNTNIDTSRIWSLIEQSPVCNVALKEKLQDICDTDLSEEKEWIVFYNGMDVGYRVCAKGYSEALLVAYEKFGAGGVITNVEEIKKQ